MQRLVNARMKCKPKWNNLCAGSLLLKRDNFPIVTCHIVLDVLQCFYIPKNENSVTTYIKTGPEVNNL